MKDKKYMVKIRFKATSHTDANDNEKMKGEKG